MQIHEERGKYINAIEVVMQKKQNKKKIEGTFFVNKRNYLLGLGVRWTIRFRSG